MKTKAVYFNINSAQNVIIEINKKARKSERQFYYFIALLSIVCFIYNSLEEKLRVKALNYRYCSETIKPIYTNRKIKNELSLIVKGKYSQEFRIS